MSRILGAARESRTGDHGTSLAGQREQIGRWASLYEHQVVHVTEDASTSGAVSPFQRDNLGPWLTRPELLAQWDILVTAKVDRVSRSVVDFHDLLTYCQEHGKSYVSVGESFDLGTAIGRMVAQILAVFAEFERERMRERAKGARERARANGYWPGGWLPFGWRAEDSGKGYVLVPDETTADLARDMAGRLAAGESTNRIAAWLNGQGVRTTHGNEWTPDAVRTTLSGQYMEGLLSDGQYEAMRLALAALKRPTSERDGDGGYMLTRVAFCGTCEGPLYAAIKRSRGYGYYWCRHNHVRVRMDRLEAFTEQYVLGRAGERPLRRRVVIRGDDHSQRIAEAESQLAIVRAIPEIDPAPLEAKLAKLREQPHEPDRVEWEATGLTIRQHWLLLSGDTDINGFLREQQVRVTLGRDWPPKVDLGLLAVDGTGAQTEEWTWTPQGAEAP